MSFDFEQAGKYKKINDVVNVYKNLSLQESVQKFVDYYNSEAYQKLIDETVRKDEIIDIYINSDIQEKITLYVGMDNKVYSGNNYIFIFNKKVLKYLTFKIESPYCNFIFGHMTVPCCITKILPDKINRLAFFNCKLENGLSESIDSAIFTCDINKCTGVKKISNIKANVLSVKGSDVSELTMHHNFFMYNIMLYLDDEYTKKITVDIDIPLLKGLHISGSNIEKTKCELAIHTNMHTLTLQNLYFNKEILWPTNAFDINLTTCTFKSESLFNLHSIEKCRIIRINGTIIRNRYISSEYVKGSYKKKIFPKKLHEIQVNMDEYAWPAIGKLKGKGYFMDMPLCIGYVYNQARMTKYMKTTMAYNPNDLNFEHIEWIQCFDSAEIAPKSSGYSVIGHKIYNLLYKEDSWKAFGEERKNVNSVRFYKVEIDTETSNNSKNLLYNLYKNF